MFGSGGQGQGWGLGWGLGQGQGWGQGCYAVECFCAGLAGLGWVAMRLSVFEPSQGQGGQGWGLGWVKGQPPSLVARGLAGWLVLDEQGG
jgi:hypothetical protein